MKIGSLAALSLILLTSGSMADTLDKPGVRTVPDSGWLGVSLGSGSQGDPIGTEAAPPGVKVLGVLRASPAQKSGLRSGDRILAVEGRTVSTAQEVSTLISGLAPGTSISLAVSRKGQDRLLTASLGARPAANSLAQMLDGWIGIESIDLPPALREHFGAPAAGGVMVSAVKAGGPAEAAGISIGDVVFEVDGEPVRSVGHLRALVTAAGIDNRLEVRAMRDGAEIVLEPTVAARPESGDSR